MADSIVSRLRKAWNIFRERESNPFAPIVNNIDYVSAGIGYFNRPDRIRMTRGNERSIITAICNRIALDVAGVDFKHVKLDKDGRYIDTIDSNLNRCLSLEANLDQTHRNLIQDVVMSCLDEGSVAIVPVTYDAKSRVSDFEDISSLRVGKILEWFPEHVKVIIYNEKLGRNEEILLHKRMVSIIENPFYSVYNEHNSTLQRLIRKLNLLDAIDEQSGSGKMNLLIQLPYALKTEASKAKAEERRTNIENQLNNSKYGIAYVDSTEHVTQLNRPLENNLMSQIEYLTSMLYSQSGVSQKILDGTADEKEMLNYQSRVVGAFVNAIVDEMKRKFLSEEKRNKEESIIYFKDPFKLVPVSQISEIADKFTRNEIMTSNEIRQIIGLKPSKDASADELRNKNLSAPSTAYRHTEVDNRMSSEEEKNNG